ncbi:hypothetical protein, partial [Burkholderia cepacia]|uniref:hypothetical protein n=1 Tax=Burkholderia cepacia TaxID=292 RepID=UPI002ABE9DE0
MARLDTFSACAIHQSPVTLPSTGSRSAGLSERASVVLVGRNHAGAVAMIVVALLHFPKFTLHQLILYIYTVFCEHPHESRPRPSGSDTSESLEVITTASSGLARAARPFVDVADL